MLNNIDAVILIWTGHWWTPCGCGRRLIFSFESVWNFSAAYSAKRDRGDELHGDSYLF